MLRGMVRSINGPDQRRHGACRATQVHAKECRFRCSAPSVRVLDRGRIVLQNITQ